MDEQAQRDARIAQMISLARVDPELWFNGFAQIKKKSGRVEQARANVMQKRMAAAYRRSVQANRPCLMIVLKPRQKGASTFAEAMVYHHMRRLGQLNGSLMADIVATSDKVFDLYRRYVQNDRFDWTGLGGSNFADGGDGAEKIVLTNESCYWKETAGSKNAGRGGTVQVARLDEVAFWPVVAGQDAALAYLQAFASEERSALGIATSTPNGPRGWFYDTWTKENQWTKIFAAWWEFDDSMKEFEGGAEEAEEFMAKLREDEREELARFPNLTAEHLHWRRVTIQDKCQGDIDKFKVEYPSDAIQCFLRSSRPRFNVLVMEKWANRALHVERDWKRGNAELQDNDRASWRVDPEGGQSLLIEHPIPGCSYLISADPAAGETQTAGADPDNHAVQVWRQGFFKAVGMEDRWVKPAIVGVHKSRIDIDLLAEVIAGLAAYFGDCLVVPEVNNTGLALINCLLTRSVSVYRRQVENRQTKNVDRQYGWRTDAATRKTIIDELAAVVREDQIEVTHPWVIDEMKTFVTGTSGRPEALPGTHDDQVLCAAIGYKHLSSATLFESARRAPQYSPSQLAMNPTLGTPAGFHRAVGFDTFGLRGIGRGR
jgi:hypothetical protein